MSGNFGWGGGKRQNDPAPAGGFNFDPAKQGYNPSVKVIGTPTTTATSPGLSKAVFSTVLPKTVNVAAPSVVHVATVTPDGLKAVKSSAKTVLIIAQDVTGSMASWLDEIFERLPRLHADAAKYTGDPELEILFICYGDGYSDKYVVQVAPKFGNGPELDTIITSFNKERGGGGSGQESAELVAYYILKQVDISSAKRAYLMFVTDETGYDVVNPDQVKRFLGQQIDPQFSDPAVVFTSLQRKVDTYTIVCDIHGHNAAQDWWKRTIGDEHVVHLDQAKRVVDVMLGIIAMTVGKDAAFAQDLKSRQAGTKFGAQNVKTVLGSIAMVGGRSRQLVQAPALPAKKSVLLLPSPSATTSAPDNGSDSK